MTLRRGEQVVWGDRSPTKMDWGTFLPGHLAILLDANKWVSWNVQRATCLGSQAIIQESWQGLRCTSIQINLPLDFFPHLTLFFTLNDTRSAMKIITIGQYIT